MEPQRQEGSDHQQSFILNNDGGWNFKYTECWWTCNGGEDL